MKKQILILVLSFLFVPICLQAKTVAGGKGHNHEKHSHPDKEAVLKKVNATEALIKVHGMVCAFCAQGVEKIFNKRKEVKETKVNLDKMEVRVLFKKGFQVKESEMKKIVESAGFKFKGITYGK